MEERNYQKETLDIFFSIEYNLKKELGMNIDLRRESIVYLLERRQGGENWVSDSFFVSYKEVTFLKFMSLFIFTRSVPYPPGLLPVRNNPKKQFSSLWSVAQL